MLTRPITFYFRGRTQQVNNVAITMTVLQYLREYQQATCDANDPEYKLRQTGTKEGCAEGDCGACTVVVAELVNGELVLRSINACIQFLALLDGKALFTVEDLKHITEAQTQAEDSLHPVQRAMVEQHGSQCGFCTPGFVMSLWAMYENEVNPISNHKVADYISGNLCRCTGYRPILDAAQHAYSYPRVSLNKQHIIQQLVEMQKLPALQCSDQKQTFYVPRDLKTFAELKKNNPQARIIAGCTDVGLWVTKLGRDLGDVLAISQVAELKEITITNDVLNIGANVNLTEALAAITRHYPSFNELARRFASMPIKNAGTLGGNIANGSPIGDSMPALIVLDTQLTLRLGETSRSIALEDFYLDYQKTALQQGEFVEKIHIPLYQQSTQFKFASYKIAKRYEQDISAVCAAMSCVVDDDHYIQKVKIAFGGMAAIPKRAKITEACLVGQVFDQSLIEHAKNALAQDYQPLSDGRASADYRLRVAQNCLDRFYLEQIESQSITRLDQLIDMVEV